ncbi:MAG: cupredoxin domain-containing protein [Actinomycetota bacterium]
MTGKRILAALGVVALLGAACGVDEPAPGGASASGSGGDEGGGGSVTLTADDFSFAPGTVTVAAEDSIELSNEGEAPHNLQSKEAGLDADVEAGESVSIDLADVEAGTYDFICKFHPDDMTGILEITG